MNAYSCKLIKSHKKSILFRSIKPSTLNYSTFTTEDHLFNSFSLPEKLASYLEHCSDPKSLKKLHACVITQGLQQNIFLGSKLLNSLARFNLLAESKWVFNKIINNNLSLWNSVIVGYFRANQYCEVLGIYSDLRKENIGIHSSALTFGLKSCVELGSYEFGRSIHTDGFKFGFSCDPFVGSSLIGFYSDYGEVREASKVFDEITDRDVVAYTSIITGYAQVDDFHANEAFGVAADMQRDGFEPNRVTLVSLLRCASRLGMLDKGKCIHGFAIRRGVGFVDKVFETSIIDMYIKCGDLVRGTAIFEKMNNKTTACWNALVSGHLRLGQPLEAFNLFRQMVHENSELDLVALGNGLLSCADLGYLVVGKTIHCHVLRQGRHLDLVSTTALIDMYCKCKHLPSAMNVFHRTEDKDGVLYNVMISGFLYNGYVYKAIETFREMVNMCIRPNVGTIISVLSALSDMEDVRKCNAIHGYVFRQGLEEITDIGNQLIHMYAKCGVIQCARKVFDRLEIKDTVSWTSMMTCLMNHGLANEAVTLFISMQRENLRPDSVTFTTLLQALNQLGSVLLASQVHGHLYRVYLEKDVGLTNSLLTTYSKCGKFEMASNLFEQMNKRDLSSWNTMIAAYGMHGNCDRALRLFDQMKEENLAPDGVTFKSILSACSHSGFVQEGLDIFRSMEEQYGIIPSDEHYGCMVDLLGRAGRVEEAYDILKSVPSRQNASTLGALLGACRTHGNSDIGERVGKWLLELEPQSTSAYCSVSNLHALGEKWDEVEEIGAIAEVKGLRRTSGYSMIEFN